MKLTTKQISDLNKAKAMVEKAYLIINRVEQESDLKYSMNETLASKTESLINSFGNEIALLDN